MNVEQITEAFKNDPTLISAVLPSIIETEPITTFVNNKANSLFSEKISEEVKKIHGRYDDDIFAILGERAGTGEDGQKMKTYDLMKSKLTELKELKGQKDSLTKDAEVQRLTGEIEKLKKEGGSKHIQDVFDQAKQQWESEKQTFMKQISEANTANEDYKKSVEIKSAFSQLKFNPDTPESLKNLVIRNIEDQLVKSSKFENGKLVFVDQDGKPIIEPTTHDVKTPLQMLMSLNEIKDITLNDQKKPGGGADPTITGSIKTVNVEGKDEKSLILDEGSFKTRSEFTAIAEKALMDSGVSRRDPDFQKLMTKAYNEHKVASLPAK